MRKNFLFTLAILSAFLFPFSSSASLTLKSRLAGKILLQVQDHGEAWYVDPLDLKRYYLGRPADAFDIMRSAGLGIRHGILSKVPPRLAGRILIDVDDHGRAYYVDPDNLEAYYLGRPADALDIMRRSGLGITDADIDRIAVGQVTIKPVSPEKPPVGLSETQRLERQVADLINGERTSRGLPSLRYNQTLAQASENHVQDMLKLGYFDHNRPGKKFYDFPNELGVRYTSLGENIATGFSDAASLVQGWMNSPGHRENILGDYTDIGVGIALNPDGTWLAGSYYLK